jgi:hypothetical protein
MRHVPLDRCIIANTPERCSPTSRERALAVQIHDTALLLFAVARTGSVAFEHQLRELEARIGEYRTNQCESR